LAHRLFPRVAENCSAPGTSAFTLTGALVAHGRFNAIPSIATSDTTEYHAVAVDGSGVPTGLWEEGIGTYSAANTLSRSPLNGSSGPATLVNFTGATVVLLTPIGARLAAIPRGGSTGQVPAKASANDFDLGWATPAKSMELVSSASASNSATVDFTGLASGYDYQVRATGVLPQGASDTLSVRVSEDNGSTWKSGASDYYQASASQSSVSVGYGFQVLYTGHGFTFNLEIPDPGGSKKKFLHARGLISASAGTYDMPGGQSSGAGAGGLYASTNAINGIRFYFLSNNIASGDFLLYRIPRT
jgi:hypothetical protein